MNIRVTFCAALLAALSFLLPQSAAGKKASGKAKPQSETVEFFTALDAGRIGVTVIPRDATQMTVQVKNETDKPLTIRLPDTIAAVPVLAQMFPQGGPFQGNNLFGGGNLAGGNNLQGGNQAPQGLGGPFGGRQGNNNRFLGMFSVLPGKVVRKKLPCVCLDFGKPNPKPQMPYRIERLESVNAKSELRDLLCLFGKGGCSHRTAQIAAWHLANDMSWEQLARLRYKRANGATRPRYSAAELQLAKQIVERLPSRKPPERSESVGDRLSRR